MPLWRKERATKTQRLKERLEVKKQIMNIEQGTMNNEVGAYPVGTLAFGGLNDVAEREGLDTGYWILVNGNPVGTFAFGGLKDEEERGALIVDSG